MDSSEGEGEWVTGVCTEAWQEDCREVLSAVGQFSNQLKGELKRVNSARQQRNQTRGIGWLVWLGSAEGWCCVVERWL